MIEQRGLELPRAPETKQLACDLCIVGGGLAGTCGAITAARAGLAVVLIQDRPVLGGNSSSEVRLWALGASAHNHNNNRWAREGGVIDELLVENMHRNPEGNPIIYDTILLERVTAEKNITLLLNTVATDIDVTSRPGDEAVRVNTVYAYCSQTQTRYQISPRFVTDATGDGLIAYLAGLPFRIGAESSGEFGEGFAPDPDQYGELLGHSIFFMTKDAGAPVSFTPPSYALADAERRIPRIRSFSVNDQGCEFWWIEYGGRLDTIHDTEEIKWELWRIVFGVWDYIKNSGHYPEAANLTLEWVGHIPGKRESRRFEGLTMLTQADLVEQRSHDDAVSFGGWSLDLHPADGVYTARPGCDQYHTKGVYQIPYTVMVSPDASNLFLAGRIISCSHVAFGSTRVMCTCAHNAQAIAMAAAKATREGITPAEIDREPYISQLQRALVRRGQHIPGYRLIEDDNLVASAELDASSRLDLGRDLAHEEPVSQVVAHEESSDAGGGGAKAVHRFGPSSLEESAAGKAGGGDGGAGGGGGGLQAGHWAASSSVADSAGVQRRPRRDSTPSYGEYQRSDGDTHRPLLFPDTTALCPLTRSVAQMVPVAAGRIPPLSFTAEVLDETALDVELRISSKRFNYTPDVLLEELTVSLEAGTSLPVRVAAETAMPHDAYLYVVFRPNELVALHTCPKWITGLFRLERTGYQEPPLEWGIDGFEIWTPPRRPFGQVLAFTVHDAPEEVFAASNVANGYQRPGVWPNAWVATPDERTPTLTARWPDRRTIRRVEIVFDTDYNHPMESVIRGHPERDMPMCARRFRLLDETGRVIAQEDEWYHSLWARTFPQEILTHTLVLEVLEMNGNAPAAVFDLRAYTDPELP